MLDHGLGADLVLRQLGSRMEGLDDREAARRLLAHGRNELASRSGRSWPGRLLHQLAHPLALLLWVAAALAWVTGSGVVAMAIVAVDRAQRAGLPLFKSSKRNGPSSC